VSAALFAMILIPLAESFLRRTFHTGIPASTSIVQHMVLVVGMLGGAIAARDGRLLSLSTFGDTHLRGRLEDRSRGFLGVAFRQRSPGFCAWLLSNLCKRSEVQGKFWPTGSQCGFIEYVLPVGFALIAIRILLHTSQTWGPRIVAAACGALVMGP